MTHEELLTKLDGQIAGSKAIGCKCPACDNAVALRAVVELHKPIGYDLDQCRHCLKSYPCPTILIIQKELK